ncbi:MAG: hypothetical protein FJ271_25385 [Planctomycetes bacterium]|nr:hypothetical protein [Planctomycetota bacterium]
MRIQFLSLLTLWTLAGSVSALEKSLSITLTAGKHDLKDVPVCVPLSLPKEQAKHGDAEVSAGEAMLVGQLTPPSITTEDVRPAKDGLVRRDLHFRVPALMAGQSITVTVKTRALTPVPDPTVLKWLGESRGTELVLAARTRDKRRPILRYMNQAYDKSTPDRRDRTYKVFHHLYDLAGKGFVTNGGENDLKSGEKKKLLYPHHRGLMFAFNRISYGDKQQADTWHCNKGEHQSHVRFLNEEAGQVLGRHRALIDWHGRDDAVFAKEERELTVYNMAGGTLVEFAARLRTANGPIKLDGDPQHAGFQFRAANEVAATTAAQTYYLRPDGKDEPGKTRNWPEVKTHINLPWNAMSFVLGGKRYTAVYLNHPRNPGESRWSERDYGRFGCYFAYELTAERPLVVNYRIWLQNGEMTGEQATALSNAFVAPPTSK